MKQTYIFLEIMVLRDFPSQKIALKGTNLEFFQENGPGSDPTSTHPRISTYKAIVLFLLLSVAV